MALRKKKQIKSFKQKIQEALDRKGIDDLMIFRYYLGNITLGKTIKSPLPYRKDKRASFGIFNANSTVLFKDQALGKSGDKFILVQELFNLQYPQNLIKVIKDFDLDVEYYESKDNRVYKSNKQIPKKTKYEQGLIKLDVAIHQDKQHNPFYTKQDIVYWSKRNIENVPYRLKRNRVYSAKMVYRNGISFWGYLPDNPIYAYLYKYNGVYYWKVYRPLNKDSSQKFYNDMKGVTQYCLDGIWNLPEKGEILIITKSRKDVVCLDELGFNVIGIASEGNNKPIAQEIYNDLLQRFNKIYLLYDNDWNKDKNWGQINANRVIQRYKRMNNIFIPSNYKCSDTDELMVKYSKNRVLNIIKKLL